MTNFHRSFSCTGDLITLNTFTAFVAQIHSLFNKVQPSTLGTPTVFVIELLYTI